MLAVIKFLDTLALLVALRNGGQENDVTKLLRLGAAGVRAKKNLDDAFAEANAKVQQLVDEDRAMTDEENAALDKSIEDKLARAAAVDLDETPPPVG